MELRTAEQKVVEWAWACVCGVQSGQLGFPGLTVLDCDMPAAPHHHKYNSPSSLCSPSLRTAKASAVRRGQTWRKMKEGGVGQGLSIEKTAMKGNCHAPVLAQEHLSQKEHAKCAGHVLKIPSLLFHIHTARHRQAHRKGRCPTAGEASAI